MRGGRARRPRAAPGREAQLRDRYESRGFKKPNKNLYPFPKATARSWASNSLSTMDGALARGYGGFSAPNSGAPRGGAKPRAGLADLHAAS